MGLFVAIVLAAIVSTVDSVLVVAGSAAVRDVYADPGAWFCIDLGTYVPLGASDQRILARLAVPSNWRRRCKAGFRGPGALGDAQLPT